MKTRNNIMTKKYLYYLLFALGGLLLGWLLFGSPTGGAHSGHSHIAEGDTADAWICSMHPQIVMDKQGKCPICAMDLIPRKTSGGGEELDPSAIQLSEEAMALANVHTTRVSLESPAKSIRLYGKIVPDERGLQSQTAHVSGRIEKLNIKFTGETVREGQTLATIYSPELLTAQQELLQAVAMQQPQLVQAAREKLQLWHITSQQIDHILQSKQPSAFVEIKATTSGVVTDRRVNQGDYVAQGAVLFDIANLSRLWAVFDAFEGDLSFLSVGDSIGFKLTAYPGRKYSGKISFIDPMINPSTRTARVRVNIANSGMELKPEMYAMAEVQAKLRENPSAIIIPQTAVLWTGKRSVVYVRQRDASMPTFLMREVELGPSLGGAYVVLDGLSEGEEVVTSGVFALDASAQLEGKKSMMNVVPDSENSKEIKFGVRGSCGMCKDLIEKTALDIYGVEDARWSKDEQMLYLRLNTAVASEQAVSKAIAKIGYDTEYHKAESSVFDQLPGCCKYDR